MAKTAQKRFVRGRRVLIAGGGVAALETLLALGQLAPERVDVELLAPEASFHYRPLDVTAAFGLGGIQRLDLGELAHGAGARLRLGAVAAVDPQQKWVETRTGEQLGYDALVVATGARARPALEGVLTFWGEPEVPRLRRLLSELDARASRVAFVLPGGSTWPLPLYELAFMTAGELASRRLRGIEVAVVTYEAAPLELFGRAASDAVAALLERDGIRLHPGRYAAGYANGRLELVPGGELAADHVVALPRLEGPEIQGLPQDENGFLPTDRHGRVGELFDVYAAGDATTFPIKQGGLAAQQADAVARTIAAWAGAAVEPTPFRPVLRGELLTAGAPRFLRADPTGGRGDTSEVDFRPLWWPPGKIAGRYLAPFLAGHGVGDPVGWPRPEGLEVEIDLTERIGAPAAAAVRPA